MAGRACLLFHRRVQRAEWIRNQVLRHLHPLRRRRRLQARAPAGLGYLQVCRKELCGVVLWRFRHESIGRVCGGRRSPIAVTRRPPGRHVRPCRAPSASPRLAHRAASARLRPHRCHARSAGRNPVSRAPTSRQAPIRFPRPRRQTLIPSCPSRRHGPAIELKRATWLGCLEWSWGPAESSFRWPSLISYLMLTPVYESTSRRDGA